MSDIQRIECTCSRHPLLATFGVESGVPFVHILSTRSRKIVVDATFMGGIVDIRCRECLRQHRLNLTNFVPGKVPRLKIRDRDGTNAGPTTHFLD